MTDFSWQSGLIGGALIGISAVLLLLGNGRIAGISGILGQLLKPASSLPWQWGFVIGLLVAGIGATVFNGPLPLQIDAPIALLCASGLLVGFGTRLGSGCTSGHGVCGMARISPRSLVATGIFVSTAMLTVFLVSMVTAAA